MKQLGQKWES